MVAVFRLSDQVVYRVTKHTHDPGPRAEQVFPAQHGDTYTYLVSKFWVVADIQPDGQLVLVTRRGKQHVVAPDDPKLRHATLWERWWYRRRFPDPTHLAGNPSEVESTTSMTR